MLGRVKEALQRKPDPLKDLWATRCRNQRRIDARVTYGSRNWRDEKFNELYQNGIQHIKGILEAHGEEITTSLVENEALENLNIVTQLEVLSLAKSEGPTLIVNALNSIPEEERKDWKDPLYRQNKFYEDFLAEVLSQRDGEDFERVMKIVKGGDPLIGHRWEWILDLCRQRGSKFMTEALKIIPPYQISSEKIDQRLKLEERLLENEETPVERRVTFKGYVQGVGFRGRCQDSAEEWGITTGWARNEVDGTVTLVLQGEPSRLSLIKEELEKPKSRQAVLVSEKPLEEAEEILGRFEIRVAEGAEYVGGLL
jgi:acylphosphatase